MWITLLVGVMLLGILTGCADFKETNAMIAESNLQSRKAYADALVACQEDQGCKVGVTASYFSNAGQQKFFKPESAKDYLEAGLPYLYTVERVWGSPRGGSNKGGITIVGDDNVVSDVANDTKLDNGSSLVKSMTISKSEEHLVNLGEGQASLDKSQRTEVMPEPAPVEVIE